jgi:predicted lipoprotein with Yx(FWY)xxD motif
MLSFAAVAGAAVIAACGSSGSSTSGSSTPPSPAASSATGSGAASGAALKTASVGSLGTIVVDGKSMTVYRFDADTNKPPTSHCTGSCTTFWPPVPAGTGTPQVQGVSASLIGTVTRDDGTKQLTLAGWPLYTYAGDKAAGDASGQGVNAFGATWWAVTPAGAKAASSSGSSPSMSPSGGSGY